MKKANIDFSGVVSVSKVVHGIEVRGLNFADISAYWQADGKRLIDVYNELVAAGVNAETDMLSMANAIIKHAPDLARAAFLAAINDDGSPHDVGNGIDMTAGDIWDNLMSIGKQSDFLFAIIELTLSETDNLKKKLLDWTTKLKVVQPTYMTAQAKVEANITK
nr:MAG TPA: hypothetical protein [Caudoviricetes sp.]